MGFADLHIHTIHSWDGTATVQAVLKRVRDYTGLTVVAITDHDRIEGALEGEQLGPSYGLEVIPGCEISTADGHLLAYWIHKVVPAGLPLVETVLRVGEQGGLCVAAHPTGRASYYLKADTIRQALNHPQASRILVGIETFNAGLVNRRINRGAQRLADDLPVAQVGGSDAHLLWMLGQGATQYPGESAEDLRQALLNRQTQAVRGEVSPLLRLLGGWVTHFTLRKVGWITANVAPHTPLVFARLHGGLSSPNLTS